MGAPDHRRIRTRRWIGSRSRRPWIGIQSHRRGLQEWAPNVGPSCSYIAAVSTLSKKLALLYLAFLNRSYYHFDFNKTISNWVRGIEVMFYRSPLVTSESSNVSSGLLNTVFSNRQTVSEMTEAMYRLLVSSLSWDALPPDCSISLLTSLEVARRHLFVHTI